MCHVLSTGPLLRFFFMFSVSPSNSQGK
jgi:hypothetical protein